MQGLPHKVSILTGEGCDGVWHAYRAHELRAHAQEVIDVRASRAHPEKCLAVSASMGFLALYSSKTWGALYELAADGLSSAHAKVLDRRSAAHLRKAEVDGL